MSTSPVRVTGTPPPERHYVQAPWDASPWLRDSEPDDLLSRAAQGIVEREEHRSDFETFGVGEVA